MESKSVYFHDAEENILEFISRYNLKDSTKDDFFDTKHILNVSEIGVAVEDNTKFAEVLKEHFGRFFKEILWSE